MRRILAVLIDIDGVLTISWKPLPGAVAALRWLRAAAFPLALVTSTTSRTRASIAGALAEAGFPVTAGDILTASACRSPGGLRLSSLSLCRVWCRCPEWREKPKLFACQ